MKSTTKAGGPAPTNAKAAPCHHASNVGAMRVKGGVMPTPQKSTAPMKPRAGGK